MELAVSSRASEHFEAEAAERERHFHEREIAAVRLPVTALQRPWPPRGLT
jgi:hypothetical protein